MEYDFAHDLSQEEYELIEVMNCNKQSSTIRIDALELFRDLIVGKIAKDQTYVLLQHIESEAEAEAEVVENDATGFDRELLN
jgi:hypothetical protein